MASSIPSRHFIACTIKTKIDTAQGKQVSVTVWYLRGATFEVEMRAWLEDEAGADAAPVAQGRTGKTRKRLQNDIVVLVG